MLFEKCTISDIQQKLIDFPKRYHHYKLPKRKNIWVFSVVSQDKDRAVIQLIDKTFEPPRGRVRSDQPYIYLKFQQNGEDAMLTYRLVWQKRKTALLILGCCILLVLSLANIVCGLRSSNNLILGAALMMIGICSFILWLVQNKRHDQLTVTIFEEIMQKNFSIWGQGDGSVVP